MALLVLVFSMLPLLICRPEKSFNSRFPNLPLP